MRRSLWPVLVFASLGFVLLVALGIWQLQRLQWKEALIAAIDDSIAGPAITLEEARKRPGPAYAKVKLSGTFSPPGFILMIGATKGGPAWSVIRPFSLADGTILILDTGKIGEGEPPAPPPGEVTAEALLKLHPDRKGMFDPDNPKPGRQWFWWDVPAMAQALGATETAFTAQLLPGEPGTEGLSVDKPRAALQNNHLGYAITWFGLAAVLAVMTGLLLYRYKH